MKFGLKSMTVLMMSTMVAGCGGSDRTLTPDAPDPVITPDGTSESFDVLNDNFEILLDERPTTASPPPDTGSADFIGFFQGRMGPNVGSSTGASDVAGDAVMFVDFADAENTRGAIYNLQSNQIDEIEGVVSMGLFSYGGTGTLVTLSGAYGGDLEITDPDYPTDARTVFGSMTGGYSGTDGQYLGLSASPFGDENNILFRGNIVVEQQ